MTRYLGVLDTVITLSPLLGLLGTVTGMIRAFGVMAGDGREPAARDHGGVAEALVATAAGLAVAIGALVPYNYFLRRVEREHRGDGAVRLPARAASRAQGRA